MYMLSNSTYCKTSYFCVPFNVANVVDEDEIAKLKGMPDLIELIKGYILGLEASKYRHY